jgi:hypothetical protein
MYDKGLMDGANGEGVDNPEGSQKCPVPTQNVPFAYVNNDSGQIQPYLDIAKAYGFANYMFQTNQGPSFPAHQFLFSGTSAPIAYPAIYYDWFAAENPPSVAGKSGPTGCVGAQGQVILEMDNTAPYTESAGYAPPDPQNSDQGFPCYNHNTLATLLDSASPKIAWKYYGGSQTGLWIAPVAIHDLCLPSTYEGGSCTGTEFNANVVTPSAQVLTDIQNCALPQVSFVTPDGAWSDHSGPGSQGWGPSWVAAIVNAIGNGMTGSTCNPTGGQKYWSNTVILVTWDDWGGWYDHVAPGIGYSNKTGQQYVYGFRVPLLVVSAYMAKANSTGYVSGYSSGAPTSCPTTPNSQYCHDFGSVLNFIEYVFGTNGSSLGQIGPVSYPYADYLALDAPFNCGTSCPYSLSDFFNFNQKPNTFTPISAPYGPYFFINYTGLPQDPDLDGEED